MVTALGVLIVALSATPPVLAGLWVAEWWRSGRRNRRGECGACGQALGTESEDRYLVSGRLICSGCTTQMNRRMPWMLGALGVLVTGTAIGVAMVVDGWEWMLNPLITFSATIGTLQLMKVANRRAQRRIAAGEIPQIMPGQTVSSESEKKPRITGHRSPPLSRS